MVTVASCAAKQVLGSLNYGVGDINAREEVDKTREETSHSPAAESQSIIHFGFDDRCSGRLPPGYTQQLMAIGDIRQSWLLNCPRPAWVRNAKTDEKYDHITFFPPALSLQESHRTNILLSMKPVLFLRYMIWAHNTADAENEHRLVTDPKLSQDKALCAKDGLLALSFFAERRTAMPRQSYTTVQSFWDSYQHHQGLKWL